VFKDFPKLKIVLSHGGGAIPYQLGRFEAPSLRRGTGGRFSDSLRKLYFDTVLYTEDALRLLIKTVGVDRCLFGTECPGIGSSVDPATGRSMDNVKAMIENIKWLSAADRKKIFEENPGRCSGCHRRKHRNAVVPAGETPRDGYRHRGRSYRHVMLLNQEQEAV